MEAGNGDIEKMKQRLDEVNRDYLSRSKLYDQYYEDFSRCSQEIQLKKQALDAFGEAVNMFEEQIRLHEKFQREAHRHEIHSLMENYELLKSRMASLSQSRAQLQKDLREQADYSRTLDREMNALKPELHQLGKTRDLLQMWLLRHGKNPDPQPGSASSRPSSSGGGSQMTEESVSPSPSKAPPPPPPTIVAPPVAATPSGGIENWAFDATGETTPQQTVSEPCPLPFHADSQFWLLPDCTRNDAERLLTNKADGTFLIRRSAGPAPYALSIAYRGVDNKGFGHILIHRSERGFGFTEPYLLFRTLNDLVVHYASHSLEEHNPHLTTTLAHPLHGPQPDSSHYVI